MVAASHQVLRVAHSEPMCSSCSDRHRVTESDVRWRSAPSSLLVQTHCSDCAQRLGGTPSQANGVVSHHW